MEEQASVFSCALFLFKCDVLYVGSSITAQLANQPIVNSAASNPEGKSSSKKRILLVDDHPGFRRGLTAILREKEGEYEVCGEAQAAPAALHAMRQSNPDFAILDISLPGANGIELIKMMLAEQPSLRILVLSAHQENTYALRAMRAGARGYIMKSEALETIPMAIDKIAAGGIYLSSTYSDRLVFQAINSDTKEDDSPVASLSDRELEVLALLGKGHGTQGAADILHLSAKTIETHRMHIKEKLGLSGARELVRFAIEWYTAEQERAGAQ